MDTPHPALDDLTAWCASYVAAFSAYDVQAIGAHWVFPATILAGGRPLRLESREKFDANTDTLCGFYRAQGVARARRSLRSATPLGAASAAIQVDDVVEDAGGGVITRWRAGYVLVKTAQGWRACLADADGERAAWAARGTPLGKGGSAPN
ncbi:MAG: hypothetical protein AAGH87_00380 [Pseudomonadota bacterium]